jgi:UDP-4-amino-4,6-dideoxy-N-acetyl-beta-L-altrosamine N-acetyltransferase
VDSLSLIVTDFRQATREQLIDALQWRNHPDVRKWMLNSTPIDEGSHLKFVNTLESRSQTDRYWIVDNVGVVYLNKICKQKKSAYLGIYANFNNLAKKKGEVLLLELFRLGFEGLELSEIKLEVFKSNGRAIALYEKVGFREISDQSSISVEEDPKKSLMTMLFSKLDYDRSRHENL